MTPHIVAVAYLYLALFSAFAWIAYHGILPWQKRAFFFWFIATPLVFLYSQQPGPCLLLLALAYLACQPRTRSQRVPFFLAAYAAVPQFIVAKIPFPGLNYLTVIDFQRMTSVIAILPMLATAASEPSRTVRSDAVSLIIAAFLSLSTLLMIRELPATSVLRFGVDQLLSYWLVFRFIVRFVDSRERLEHMLRAFLTLAVILGCIAAVSQAKRWNFYGLLDTGAAIWKADEIRYGLLRTSATVNPVLLGLVSSAGIILALRKKLSHLHSVQSGLVITALLAFTLVSSMSRGAWLAGATMLFSYWLVRARWSNRFVVICHGALAIFVAVILLFNSVSAQELDPFGTFSYRQDLYRASWEQFLSAPVLGQANYLASGRFDHLTQGEGIIDIVSAYLQIVLQLGLIGLALYFAPFLLTLIRLLKLRSLLNAGRGNETDADRQTLAAVFSFLAGYLVLIATVSHVSLVPHFGYLLLAAANAGYFVVHNEGTPAR